MMHKKQSAKWFFILSISFLMAACTSAPPKDYYYRLQLNENVIAIEKEPLITGVVVKNFQASGLLRERGIVYIQESQPNEVHQYHYHSWIESPSILFQQLMVDFLRQSNFSSLVVTPGMNVDTEYEIRGRVDRFELLQGASPSVLIKMEIMLRSIRQNKMIYLGRYQQKIPLSNGTVTTSVGALSQAVNQVYQQFLREVRGSL